MDNEWLIYEQEKKKLQNLNLSPEEYSKAIKELIDELNL